MVDLITFCSFFPFVNLGYAYTHLGPFIFVPFLISLILTQLSRYMKAISEVNNDEVFSENANEKET